MNNAPALSVHSVAEKQIWTRPSWTESRLGFKPPQVGLDARVQSHRVWMREFKALGSGCKNSKPRGVQTETKTLSNRSKSKRFGNDELGPAWALGPEHRSSIETEISNHACRNRRGCEPRVSWTAGLSLFL